MPPIERLGVFGGTFDPLHIAHMVAAMAARHELGLDRVLFVVAHVPWQKVSEREVSSSWHRYQMVDAALDEVEGLEASDIEIRRGGDSYTADTLAQLASPNRELYLILGSDAAQGLPTWERGDEVKELSTLVVVDRPGTADMSKPEGWDWEVVNCPLLDLSATDLRSRICDGKPVEFLVPPQVLDYLDRHDLYSEACTEPA